LAHHYAIEVGRIPMSEALWKAGAGWRGYAGSVAVTIACTTLAWAMMSHFELSNLIMVYMLGVVVTAVRWGRGPSVLASVLAVAGFDFFFVPPYFTFAVADTQYVVTFAVMLVVGLVISQLTAQLRHQAQVTAEARLHVEAERLRNSLLSAISHDLRTPLAAIVGASSSLMEEDAALTPEARRALGRDVLESSRRMSELVDKVLDMARLQSGVIQLKREWFPLEEIVGSALAQLKGRLQYHPVSVDLPPELPWVSADARMLEQVLVNLIENAVKYTPAGTPLQVNAMLGDGQVSVEVADRGAGIAPGSEERIFEKFYRGREEGTEGGVGLGLAICRLVVEAHGGMISASNRQGGGARFSLTLPLAGQPPHVERELDD